jgi:hypothetical protein
MHSHVADDFGAASVFSGDDTGSALSPVFSALTQTFVPTAPTKFRLVDEMMSFIDTTSDLQVVPNELYVAERSVELRNAQKSLLSRLDLAETMVKPVSLTFGEDDLQLISNHL